MIKRLAALVLLTFVSSSLLFAQTDWIRTGTGLGVEKVRLAVPDFKAASNDAQTAPLLTVFNETLWNDLDNAGIFDLVSKSFYPLSVPGTPPELQLAAWSNPPVNASILAFRNSGCPVSDAPFQASLYDL